MIGIDYQTRMNQILSESPTSMWMDLKTTFDFLYEAARDFSKEVKAVHSSCTLTTAAGTIIYPLPSDFMEIMTEDGYGNKRVELTSGSATTWLSRVSYGHILADHNTTSVPIPTRFAVTDAAPVARITGTAAASTNVGGETTLTDASASFTGVVNPGDDVINTDEGYIGKVLSVTSGTALRTAMFNVASNHTSYADWGAGDAYLIQPAARYAIVIDPPPATAGQTISVSYLCRPAPVYSDYGSYLFATGYEEALIKYAVWLYKYRDSKGNQGDPLYQVYDLQLRKAKTLHRGATTPRGFRISFIKR